MSLRVVQWATGSVGVAAIKAVLEHPELELVGAWVHSKAKAGRDIGVLAGVDPIGVTATDSIDEILAMDADAVIYAPLLPNVDEVTALLRSGKNVVSPVGWFYPGESEAAPLRAARRSATSASFAPRCWRSRSKSPAPSRNNSSPTPRARASASPTAARWRASPRKYPVRVTASVR